MFISLLVDILFVHTSCYWFQRNCSLALHRDVQYRNSALNCFILSNCDQTSFYPDFVKANITCAKTSHNSELQHSIPANLR